MIVVRRIVRGRGRRGLGSGADRAEPGRDRPSTWSSWASRVRSWWASRDRSWWASRNGTWWASRDRSGTARNRSWTSRLRSLRIRLAVVMLVPGVLALILASVSIADRTAELGDLSGIDRLTAAQAADSALVVALQEERRLAMAHAAGPDSDRYEDLRRARDRTDVARAAARSAGEALAADSLAAATQARFVAVVDGVPDLRARLDGARAGDVLVGYSDLVTQARRAGEELLHGLDGFELNGLARGLERLGDLREEATLQRSAMTVRLEAAANSRLRLSAVRMVSALDALTPAGDLDLAGGPRYGDIAGPGDAARRLVERYADDPDAVDPATVASTFDTLVAAIDLAEDANREAVAAINADRGQAAVDAAGIDTMILLVALFVGGTLVGLIATRMIRTMRAVRQHALHVAELELPEAVRRIQAGGPGADITPAPVGDDEEVGQLARAFDAVHVQAIRLATEQAALQKSVDAVYINLARRSQSLVDRQLQLLESLERDEEDPEQLSSLFRLDHLAARMRRNCENLLVLGGHAPSGRSMYSVTAIDVLRAAVSEIENYERIVVAPGPALAVSGHVAVDLQHLIAELLDNATSFSPPESPVLMSYSDTADGGMRLEIQDDGVGMSPVDLAAANEQLASPGTAGLQTARRMGLFVVGRIAARHGIAVMLADGDDPGATTRRGGLTATVVVPAAVVGPASPPSAPVPVIPVQARPAPPENGPRWQSRESLPWFRPGCVPINWVADPLTGRLPPEPTWRERIAMSGRDGGGDPG